MVGRTGYIIMIIAAAVMLLAVLFAFSGCGAQKYKVTYWDGEKLFKEGKTVTFYYDLIATDTAFARQGVARRLIATACDILDEYRAQNGFESLIFSLEIRSQNIPARSLYQSCGFEQAGLRRRFYENPQDDACIYIKEL